MPRLWWRERVWACYSYYLSCGILSNALESPHRQDLRLYCCSYYMCLWLEQRNRAGLSGSYVCFWIHVESPIRLFISTFVISLPLTNLSLVLQTTGLRLINGSVVSRFLPASFLVNCSHVWWFPVFRYNSCFYWIIKYVCERSSKFVP